MKFDTRLGCSTISFRHLPLPEALDVISTCGFREIDLGALPGVCDHVAYDLTSKAVSDVVATVKASGLTVRSVNGDIGDLNQKLGSEERKAREQHLRRLLDLTAGCGALALVLPCGAQSHDPLQGLAEDLDLVADEFAWAADLAGQQELAVWVESLHYYRLSWNLDIAEQLTKRLDPRVGLVLDVSHVVASEGDPTQFIERFGPRTSHVHLRDATPGYINHSIGNGAVDFPATFAALRTSEYEGHFSLELETRDVANPDRPEAAARAADYVSALI